MKECICFEFADYRKFVDMSLNALQALSYSTNQKPKFALRAFKLFPANIVLIDTILGTLDFVEFHNVKLNFVLKYSISKFMAVNI